MNGRDERLRHLLRDADPAREAPALDAAEVARLRRTVLGAAEREPRGRLSGPTIALACAAALAAVVFGVALWRLDPARKTPSREDRAATSVPTQRPNGRRGGPASTARDASPPSAESKITAATTPGSPSVPATSTRDDVASIQRSRNPGPRATARSLPRVIHSPAAPAEPAPLETVAAAQPATEPQERPFQLQLTAPGGTRIVWLLSSSSGR